MSPEVKKALLKVNLFDRPENTGIHYPSGFSKLTQFEGPMRNKYTNERSTLTLGYDRDHRKLDTKTKEYLRKEVMKKAEYDEDMVLEEALERRNFSKKLLYERRDELKKMLDNYRDFY